MWASVEKGDSVSLWCKKVRGWSKRKAYEDSGSNSGSGDSSDSVHRSKIRSVGRKTREVSDRGKK